MTVPDRGAITRCPHKTLSRHCPKPRVFASNNARQTLSEWCAVWNRAKGVFRTRWSATCASPRTETGKSWTCNATRCWPPGCGRAPCCECTAVYMFNACKIWKCKACSHQFSLTSGTIFFSRKLPIRDYLAAIAMFVNAVKDISALQLGRDLDVRHKTAFVVAHKLREAIGANQSGAVLSGTVEVDGMYVGGYAKQENEKAERKDRRLAEEQTGKRQSVVVASQRGGRTIPIVSRLRKHCGRHDPRHRRAGHGRSCRRSAGRGQDARLVRDAPDQPFRGLQPGRRLHQLGGVLLFPPSSCGDGAPPPYQQEIPAFLRP
jgi:hypothetical protein